MLSYKLLLGSTAFLSAAIALKFSAPALSEFAVYEVPLIYNGVVSWLKPPYLYLVINCIIITIVASTKLQSSKDGVVLQSEEAMVPVESIQSNYQAAEYKYDDVVLDDLRSDDVKEEKVLEFDGAYEQRKENQTTPFVSQFDDSTSNKENEFVIAKSTWNSVDKKDSTEYSLSNVKPPVSARFGHRRNVKASPEGGKTILGVSKPKRHDTLESTWKTITEGRAIPLIRHLRKSDSWGERDNRGQSNQENITPQKMMIKAETFNDRTNTKSPSPGSASSGGSGKMRREPSLSQDELNRRVEAFINKFNEDMRMQRQESLNQYKKMVKRSSH